MKLFFITEARFFQTSEGQIYAGEFSFSNILWERYIREFDKVYVVGRVFHVETFDNPKHLVSNVSILPVATFESPFTFLKNKSGINTKVKEYFKKYAPDSVIIRGAGSLGYDVAKFCIKRKIPYGIEVIGDPYDVFAKGVIKHPLRPLLRYLFTQYLKKAVYHAKSVIYVTRETLQKRYPGNDKAYVTYASDVLIGDFVTEAKGYPLKEPIKLISVGSLEQMYKAPDITLRAISKLVKEGITVQLEWLGHGKFMEEMRTLAENLGISSNVRFVGSVSAKEVVECLDQSAIFLLVSRTEGLPRALVEAMARALPCIGTRVGGIPELVHPDLLVEIEDVDNLCEKIKLILSSEKKYIEFSNYSIQIASEFDASALENRRNSFFKSLKA